jgi:hypothetical protein
MSFEEEKVITLRKPVELGPLTYTELNLREPTAGELEKASKTGSRVGETISLITLIAKIPRTAAEKLSQRDLLEAADFFGTFYPSGEPTEEAGQS